MMNRDVFLRDLRNELIPLSLNEQEQIIDEYISIFEIKRDAGLSDAEIIEELGNPKLIAKQFLREFNVEDEYRYTNDESQYKTNKNTGLFILVIIFDGLIGIWLAFSCLIFLLSLLLTGFVLIISSIIIPFVSGIIFPLASLASFLITFGLGLLFISGSFVLLKLFVKGINRHIKWLKSLI